MSVAVCGSKRSFFEDIPSSPSASVSKKLRRCSPSSPSSVRFAPSPSPLDHLQAHFPHMDPELLERALLECGNDIDIAIKRLQELCLGAAEATGEKMGPVEELGTTAEQAETLQPHLLHLLKPAPPPSSLPQKYLDENKKLILAILDNQNLGKLA